MNDRFTGKFSAKQTQQLLAPIRPNRVLSDPRGNSHVSQQDVTAHLIRVFGFGNFMTELLDLECIYGTERTNDEGKGTGRWDACYRATMRLTIFDENHNRVTSFEDASTGEATNQKGAADAHDLALKSAISLAKKRCAINLGDQFGLSLYNRGQMEALVGGTLVLPEKPKDEETEQKDIQEGVPEQVSMGVDEIEKSDGTEGPTEDQEKMLKDSLGATKVTTEQPESENPDETTPSPAASGEQPPEA